MHERPGDCHPLLLTSRQLRRQVASPVAQTDCLQCAKRPLPRLLGWDPHYQERHFDILSSRENWQQVERLEDESEALCPHRRPFPVRHLGKRATINQHFTGRKLIETRHTV